MSRHLLAWDAHTRHNDLGYAAAVERNVDRGTPPGYSVSNVEHDLHKSTKDERTKIINNESKIECEDQMNYLFVYSLIESIHIMNSIYELVVHIQ